MIDTRETQMKSNRPRASTEQTRPWSVDRWGRLLSGAAILVLTVLGLAHHAAWFGGALLLSSSLVITSLTDRCLMHDLLIRLGAKEREDLFLPGGSLRREVVQQNGQTPLNPKNVHACR